MHRQRITIEVVKAGDVDQRKQQVVVVELLRNGDEGAKVEALDEVLGGLGCPEGFGVEHLVFEHGHEVVEVAEHQAVVGEGSYREVTEGRHEGGEGGGGVLKLT